MSEEELEALKSGRIDELIAELGRGFPVIRRVLLSERDLYMAFMLRGLLNRPQGKVLPGVEVEEEEATPDGNKRHVTRTYRIAAVLGMAHMDGVVQHLQEPVTSTSKALVREISSGKVAKPARPYIRWLAKGVACLAMLYVVVRLAI